MRPRYRGWKELQDSGLPFGDLLQQRLDAGGISGRRKEMPLDAIAVRRPQLLKLAGRLDPFRHDFHTQLLAQRDNRAYQRIVSDVGLHPMDERLIDLDDIQREAVEVAEG